MTMLHEPGEVWHIGWDWYAHMWFVEPPFDIELDEPIKWFNDRSDAFDYVDDWIRTQPVQVGVVEQSEADSGVVILPDVATWENEGGPIARVPRSRDEQVVEPPRVLSEVHIPTPDEAQNAQQRRIAEYNQRVGIK